MIRGEISDCTSILRGVLRGRRRLFHGRISAYRSRLQKQLTKSAQFSSEQSLVSTLKLVAREV